jgi:hypothetical protein
VAVCRCDWVRRSRAAKQSDELPPPHVGPPLPESVYRIVSLPQSGWRVLMGTRAPPDQSPKPPSGEVWLHEIKHDGLVGRFEQVRA